ncbi:hypothetical protein EC988_008272, partial [Linderina pennispora]
MSTAIAAEPANTAPVAVAGDKPAQRFGALDSRRAADAITFEFEEFVKTEVKLQIEQVPAAPKSKSINDGKTGICNFFLRGHCWKGNNCTYRHLTQAQIDQEHRMPGGRFGDRAVVCKHWLRGLCKKGERCEFLHEYNLKKMPECMFYSQHGRCSNGDECVYQHIDPESRVKECPWYARGFCKHGAKCRNKHVRKFACPQYLFGFCPKGPDCPNMHPRFDLPVMHPDGYTAPSSANPQ